MHPDLICLTRITCTSLGQGHPLASVLTRLEKFLVLHTSFGNLLRRIKNDTSHGSSKVVTAASKKQNLLEGKVLFDILVYKIHEIIEREADAGAVFDKRCREFSQD